MIDLNPEVEIGKDHVLDATYNNSSIVHVKWAGGIYALVSDGQTEWTVVKSRLSKISSQQTISKMSNETISKHDHLSNLLDRLKDVQRVDEDNLPEGQSSHAVYFRKQVIE